MHFDGRNNLQGLSEELAKVVNYLNEKAAAGEFEFCDSITYWAKTEKIISPLGMGHDGGGYYFAVALAFIATGKGLIILNICRGIFKFDDKFVLL